MWHEPSISLIHLDRWHARIHEATSGIIQRKAVQISQKVACVDGLKTTTRTTIGGMIQRKAVEMGQKVAKQKA